MLARLAALGRRLLSPFPRLGPRRFRVAGTAAARRELVRARFLSALRCTKVPPYGYLRLSGTVATPFAVAGLLRWQGALVDTAGGLNL